MSAKSQRARILKHLKSGGKLTQAQANTRKFGYCGRLAARIEELRHKYGHNIYTAMILSPGVRLWGSTA